MPARAGLPDWLRRMPREATSDLHAGPVRTLKHCPPLVDAMSAGFLMPLPCDVEVADGQLSWDWTLPRLAAGHHPRAPLSFHAAAQVAGTPFQDAGQVIVKFNSFWTVELPEGWSLFATHPVNRADLPFRLLSGLVDADRFHDVGILFPAVWLDRGFRGRLPRGTPIAQCIPVPREPLSLDCRALSEAEVRRYDDTAATLLTSSGHYRRSVRAARASGAPEELGAEPDGIEP